MITELKERKVDSPNSNQEDRHWSLQWTLQVWKEDFQSI